MLNLATGRWAEGQTVVVVGDRIRTIVPASAFRADATTTVVEGHGQFVIPGLVDSHVHLFAPDDLAIYLAHGVTTVLNMNGTPSDLALRERVRRGEIVGPRIYTAGGETSGIELALHIVELYFDHDVAVKTARYTEYRGPAWQS